MLKHRLQQADASTWGPPECSSWSWGCDLTALGPEGELLCINVRNGSDAMGICWAAAQVAEYAEACRRTASSEFQSMLTWVRQKVRLGLLPPNAQSRLPESGFSRILPVLVVAEPDENSPCWERLDEFAQLEPAAKVSVVKLHRGQSPADIRLPTHQFG